MQLPMFGSWQVRILAVRLFTIHSDVYYELHIERIDAPGEVHDVRMPQHALTQPPEAGDVVELTFLMGQITAAKKFGGAG